MLQIYLSTSIALLSHFHVEKKCGLVGVVLDGKFCLQKSVFEC
jgi:hypothetical protein